MLGIALIGIGALFLWAAFTGRADAVMNALQMDLPKAGTNPSAGGGGGGGGGGSGGGGGGGGSSTDIGTHQAMDATGNVYTINSTYGAMSDTQKGDANRFANTIGNG
jgi:hypothetical protein